jgi:hypothetical protein
MAKTETPADDLLDQADELFGEQGAGATDELFGDADDLLGHVEEDDSEGWNPSEKGEGIAGVIIKIGETRSDFAKPGENPMVPTVTIQNREGKFRIIGFGSVLKREMEDLIEGGKIKVGNILAAKYWGEKPIKRGPFAGKNYKHYSVVAQPPAPRKP